MIVVLRKAFWVVLFGLTIVSTAAAQQFSLRQWTDDLNKVEAQVMAPLGDAFAAQSCDPDSGPYIRAFLEQIKVLRGEILPLSYVMLRDIALASGEILGPIDDSISCEELDHWRLVENLLRVKIEHASNVLSQLDGAGLL